MLGLAIEKKVTSWLSVVCNCPVCITQSWILSLHSKSSTPEMDTWVIRVAGGSGVCPGGWWHCRGKGDFCHARVEREQSGTLPGGCNTYNESEGQTSLWQMNKKKSILGKGTVYARKGAQKNEMGGSVSICWSIYVRMCVSVCVSEFYVLCLCWDQGTEPSTQRWRSRKGNRECRRALPKCVDLMHTYYNTIVYHWIGVVS